MSLRLLVQQQLAKERGILGSQNPEEGEEAVVMKPKKKPPAPVEEVEDTGSTVWHPQPCLTKTLKSLSLFKTGICPCTGEKLTREEMKQSWEAFDEWLVEQIASVAKEAKVQREAALWK